MKMERGEEGFERRGERIEKDIFGQEMKLFQQANLTALGKIVGWSRHTCSAHLLFLPTQLIVCPGVVVA